MLLDTLTWIALGMSVVAFAVFIYLTLKPAGGGVAQGGEDRLTAQGAVSEVTELAKALGELTDSFRKAGPALSALVASILFFLIATLGAGLDKIAK